MTTEELRDQARRLTTGDQLVVAVWEAEGLRGILDILSEHSMDMAEMLETNRRAGAAVERREILDWKRMAEALEKLGERARQLRDLT